MAFIKIKVMFVVFICLLFTHTSVFSSTGKGLESLLMLTAVVVQSNNVTPTAEKRQRSTEKSAKQEKQTPQVIENSN